KVDCRLDCNCKQGRLRKRNSYGWPECWSRKRNGVFVAQLCKPGWQQAIHYLQGCIDECRAGTCKRGTRAVIANLRSCSLEPLQPGTECCLPLSREFSAKMKGTAFSAHTFADG